jgi:hypothetical protein
MTTGRKMVLFGILIFGFLFVSSVFFSFKDPIFRPFFLLSLSILFLLFLYCYFFRLDFFSHFVFFAGIFIGNMVPGVGLPLPSPSGASSEAEGIRGLRETRHSTFGRFDQSDGSLLLTSTSGEASPSLKSTAAAIKDFWNPRKKQRLAAFGQADTPNSLYGKAKESGAEEKQNRVTREPTIGKGKKTDRWKSQLIDNSGSH